MKPPRLPAWLAIACALYGQNAAAMGMGGCMMGCSTATLIDPPRGAAFADPPVRANQSATPGIVEVNL